MEELIKKVEAWSVERGLNTADPNKQRLKLWEEFGELNAAIARNFRGFIQDSIGDMLVVLIIYCQQLNYPIQSNRLVEVDAEAHDFFIDEEISMLIDGVAFGIINLRASIQDIYEMVGFLNIVAERYDFTLEECLQSAYDEIKDRRGKMVNGVFVKESDLNG